MESCGKSGGPKPVAAGQESEEGKPLGVTLNSLKIKLFVQNSLILLCWYLQMEASLISTFPPRSFHSQKCSSAPRPGLCAHSKSWLAEVSFFFFFFVYSQVKSKSSQRGKAGGQAMLGASSSCTSRWGRRVSSESGALSCSLQFAKLPQKRASRKGEVLGKPSEPAKAAPGRQS